MKAIAMMVLGLTISVWAQSETPKPGQSYQTTRIDLDGDGKAETVGLRCESLKGGNWYSRLSVWDGQGRLLWQSMPSKQGVWAFGGWDWGISDLQLVADIDRDGRVEAVSPEPVSDVRPVTYRIYRWSGRAFTYVRSAELGSDSAEHFSWGKANINRPWIGKLHAGPSGTLWEPSSGGEIRTREVKLKADSRGFQVAP
ncbi:VCBS repeat-containing protein [bacterium]|nr:VCBS repeat-containing protein [bacterium]